MFSFRLFLFSFLYLHSHMAGAIAKRRWSCIHFGIQQWLVSKNTKENMNTFHSAMFWVFCHASSGQPSSKRNLLFWNNYKDSSRQGAGATTHVTRSVGKPAAWWQDLEWQWDPGESFSSFSLSTSACCSSNQNWVYFHEVKGFFPWIFCNYPKKSCHENIFMPMKLGTCLSIFLFFNENFSILQKVLPDLAILLLQLQRLGWHPCIFCWIKLRWTKSQSLRENLMFNKRW